MKQLATGVTLMAALALVACGPAAEPAAQTETPAAGAQAASGQAAAVAGEHEHGADRQERDAYSKPEEVYDFLGIEAGDVVVDLMAGGGYNTVRLAERVGPEGRVIAERGSDELRARVADGDLAALGNIEFVDDLAQIPDGSVDAVLAVRAYHLFPDVPATLAQLNRMLRPGGVVGIVEVRLNRPEGHDMQTHRMGEQTVISDMQEAGFEFVGSSDILRRDDDDYTVYVPEGRARFMTDRMLLKFRKPE